MGKAEGEGKQCGLVERVVQRACYRLQRLFLGQPPPPIPIALNYCGLGTCQSSERSWEAGSSRSLPSSSSWRPISLLPTRTSTSSSFFLRVRNETAYSYVALLYHFDISGSVLRGEQVQVPVCKMPHAKFWGMSREENIYEAG